ncbi:MAG: DUF5615 family PIN-like protein [Nakamurella sp.]
MRILLDQDSPVQLIEPLRRTLVTHSVDHVDQIGWGGKSDRNVLKDAAAAGYDVFVTNDSAQLDDPDETTSIRKSKLHHVRYTQRHPGVRGLALALASVISAMPDLVAELEGSDGQRLIAIRAIKPNGRYVVTDPRREPPRYWGR